MLRAITGYNSDMAFEANPNHKPAALWLRYEGPASTQTTDINKEFRTQCKSSTETSHLAEENHANYLDEAVCKVLQHFVFKRMHSVKPIFALGPIPSQTIVSERESERLIMYTEEVLTSFKWNLDNLDGHFHDQRNWTIYEQRGGAPVPRGSSHLM